MKEIKNTNKFIIHTIILSFFIGGLSILLGTLWGLMNFDFSSFHVLIRVLIWTANLALSYLVIMSIDRLFKNHLVFYNYPVICFSTAISVILVIVISNSFEYLYVVAAFSVTSLTGLIKAALAALKKHKEK